MQTILGQVYNVQTRGIALFMFNDYFIGINISSEMSFSKLIAFNASWCPQRSVWRCVATRMLELCMNGSVWRNCHTFTEPSASPWTQRAEILVSFSLTPKQSKRLSFEA